MWWGIIDFTVFDHLNSFFCAMIAAMTLKFLDPFGTGKLVLFQVTYDKVCTRILDHACPRILYPDMLITL